MDPPPPGFVPSRPPLWGPGSARWGALLGGAIATVAALLAPWTEVTLQPAPFLDPRTVSVPGWAAGAGGWQGCALASVLVVTAVLALVGPEPFRRNARPVLVTAAAAAVWGILRVIAVGRRAADLSDPAFRTSASLSWGAWLFVAGALLAFVAALLLIRSAVRRGRLLQSERGNPMMGEH